MTASKHVSGIYAITHIASGKMYVGQAATRGGIALRWSQHRSDLRKGKHHCKHLQHAWVKYGESAFAFSVLEECAADKNLLCEREQWWMNAAGVGDDSRCYNTSPTAGTPLGTKHTLETRRKLSKAKMGLKPSKETLLKRSAALRGLKRTPETRLRMSACMIGKKLSPETRLKISEVQKGKQVSTATRLKLSAAMKGRQHTAAARLKMSAAMKGNTNGTGFKHTPEARLKIATAHKGRKPTLEQRAKMSAAQKGRTHSIETKQKMAATRKGRKYPPEHCHNISAGLARLRAEKATLHPMTILQHTQILPVLRTRQKTIPFA